METLQWVGNDGVYEYDGPVSDFKGPGAAQAVTNMGTGATNANTLFGESQGEQSQILPFLSQEATNPQGFGQQTMGQMTTAGGQATAGALGSGINKADLTASRTGNQAALSDIIAAATRGGESATSNNSLDLGLQNAKLKQQQQQAGITGIGELSAGNEGSALSSLGLSNSAIQDWASANTSAWGPALGITGDITSAAGSYAQGAAKG
jgi:hypothetical protein